MSFERPSALVEKEKNPREILAEEIRGVLENEKFSVNPRLNEYFAHEIENTDRFVSIPGLHKEGAKKVNRFLKIPVDKEFDDLFERQIEITKFLKKDGHIPIRGVVSENTDRKEGQPFAIMETFEESDARIGYISSYEGGELLGKKEAQGTVEALNDLHKVNLDKMPRELKASLQQFPDTYEDFYGEIMDVVDQKVRPLDIKGGRRKEPFHEVLGRRFGVKNYKPKIGGLLERWKETIRENEGGKEMLVHGDLGPGNLFIHDDGEIEPVDYEHAGVSKNEIFATVVDYGNFRARAWNNPEFREELDKAMLKHFKSEGRKEAGEAIVSLGILRSHMILSGFFEDYPHPKQKEEEQQERREETEGDIVKAWEVAGLELE